MQKNKPKWTKIVRVYVRPKHRDLPPIMPNLLPNKNNPGHTGYHTNLKLPHKPIPQSIERA